MINLGGVGTEVVKNLVLGGLSKIEILDDSKVKEEDFATQFFLPNDESIVGQVKLPHVLASIKELNTRVDLLINTSLFSELDESYFKAFDLVIATELLKRDLLKLNEITRSLSVPLYVAGLHGMFGYILADLISHDSVKELEKGNQERTPGTKINEVKTVTHMDSSKEGKEIVTLHDEYVPLQQIFTSKKLAQQLNKRQLRRLTPALPIILAMFDIKPPQSDSNVDLKTLKEVSLKVCDDMGILPTIISEEYLNLLSQQAFTEFAPVAAILGGVVAQDVIQFLGRKDSPINNCLIFDGTRSEFPIFYL